MTDEWKVMEIHWSKGLGTQNFLLTTQICVCACCNWWVHWRVTWWIDGWELQKLWFASSLLFITLNYPMKPKPESSHSRHVVQLKVFVRAISITWCSWQYTWQYFLLSIKKNIQHIVLKWLNITVNAVEHSDIDIVLFSLRSHEYSCCCFSSVRGWRDAITWGH